ncbi:MAG: hypothetical protein LJE70_03380 [Chromatiaceae bacterium]|jgi:hypothetical protein|nr:hypothetical protein [Chromatiaceae bacterium]
MKFLAQCWLPVGFTDSTIISPVNRRVSAEDHGRPRKHKLVGTTSLQTRAWLEKVRKLLN